MLETDSNRYSRIDILVVDDETIARQRIKRFILEIGYEAEIREAANGRDAYVAIRERRPDLMFLDIEMPGMTGFELLQQLNERNFPVIFQTAYDEFALKAFEENACDYLLKPFSEERFRKALDRGLGQKFSSAKSLDGLAASLHKNANFVARLTVKAGRDIVLLPAQDIEYITSEEHVTCIYSGGREHISDLSLDRLEEILDPKEFVRIHRASMIRIAEIKSIQRGAETSVVLKCGASLTVSRRRVTGLLDLMST